jgi:hypothetical protein
MLHAFPVFDHFLYQYANVGTYQPHTRRAHTLQSTTAELSFSSTSILGQQVSRLSSAVFIHYQLQISWESRS